MLAIFHKMEVSNKLQKCRECGTCCSFLSRKREVRLLIVTHILSQVREYSFILLLENHLFSHRSSVH